MTIVNYTDLSLEEKQLLVNDVVADNKWAHAITEGLDILGECVDIEFSSTANDIIADCVEEMDSIPSHVFKFVKGNSNGFGGAYWLYNATFNTENDDVDCDIQLEIENYFYGHSYSGLQQIVMKNSNGEIIYESDDKFEITTPSALFNSLNDAFVKEYINKTPSNEIDDIVEEIRKMYGATKLISKYFDDEIRNNLDKIVDEILQSFKIDMQQHFDGKMIPDKLIRY